MQNGTDACPARRSMPRNGCRYRPDKSSLTPTERARRVPSGCRLSAGLRLCVRACTGWFSFAIEKASVHPGLPRRFPEYEDGKTRCSMPDNLTVVHLADCPGYRVHPIPCPDPGTPVLTLGGLYPAHLARASCARRLRRSSMQLQQPLYLPRPFPPPVQVLYFNLVLHFMMLHICAFIKQKALPILPNFQNVTSNNRYYDQLSVKE